MNCLAQTNSAGALKWMTLNVNFCTDIGELLVSSSQNTTTWTILDSNHVYNASKLLILLIQSFLSDNSWQNWIYEKLKIIMKDAVMQEYYLWIKVTFGKQLSFISTRMEKWLNGRSLELLLGERGFTVGFWGY